MRNYPVLQKVAPRLTEQQRVFVRAVGRGVDPVQAARDAGYPQPDSDASDMMHSPNVTAAIQTVLHDLLRNRSSPIALAILDRIVAGEAYPASARVMAARIILDRAGIVPPAAARVDTRLDRDPSELSTDELRDIVRELSAELGDRAKPVNEPVSARAPSYLIDLLE